MMVGFVSLIVPLSEMQSSQARFGHQLLGQSCQHVFATYKCLTATLAGNEVGRTSFICRQTDRVVADPEGNAGWRFQRKLQVNTLPTHLIKGHGQTGGVW